VTRDIPLAAIRDASAAIYDLVVRTPLIRLDPPIERADRLSGSEIYLKLETLQPVGSFKIRGAYNAIRLLSREEMRSGVWTVSAGNAGQGVALAARHLGVPSSVMVSDTAPITKVAAMKRFGATVVPASYDECWQTAEVHASPRMQGRFVHPFDDDTFMAGNATIGLEILDDLPDVDAVVAAVGGGGLLGGIGSALRALKPEVEILAAEPETAAPLTASLAAGEARRFDRWTASFVDGAGGKSVLPTMWPLLSRLVTGTIVVTLDDAVAAMKLVAERCHVIIEGAAACAVAAALSGRARGKIVAVVSGGNIDLTTFASLVGACLGATA
jgi:threonine dehydratase